MSQIFEIHYYFIFQNHENGLLDLNAEEKRLVITPSWQATVFVPWLDTRYDPFRPSLESVMPN